MTSINDIRSAFVQYFVKNDHKALPSSHLVPKNDPTLMFTNSGMVQFKNIFTGQEQADDQRVVTVQKCIRAGGKHNDLENVGYTARHHTFFEMLGNFSFGDYFKEQAIQLAWKLITSEFGLSPEKLFVTVHQSDQEAATLWKKIAGMSEHRIIRISTDDNFWSMGDLGPCGPCSEIFYDYGESFSGGLPGSIDQDGDRYIEIWNLVFMEFDQKTRERRVSLPHPSIDTGMGLERIAAVLQGCHDNYETDLFKQIIHSCQNVINIPLQDETKTSFRVIADHMRAISFLIAEGVFPSNEGRGYVLRRIIRRAMRHAHLLGVNEPVLYKLVPIITLHMENAWPEISSFASFVADTLYQEEVRFLDTLLRGLKLLSGMIEDRKAFCVLDGETAFKLYDTYGFPLDLTQDILRQHKMSVDLDGFTLAMDQQKNRARQHWAGSGEEGTESFWFSLEKQFGTTEFVGYTQKNCTGNILALVAGTQEVERACAGENVSILLDKTPFYAESGGQLSDVGLISGKNFEVEILHVSKKTKGLLMHEGRVISGMIERNQEAYVAIHEDRRQDLSANHSATHLLHAALRRVLGNHVTQKGSLVTPDRFRFDFSYPKALTAEDLYKIEEIVNKIVLSNYIVKTELMDRKEAEKKGAMALFGEKYGQEVRVVRISDASLHDIFSIELCGGTHVNHSGEIGLIRIISESAVGAGIRRIEALRGEAARLYCNLQEHSLRSVAAILKVSPADVLPSVQLLQEEKKKMEQQLAHLRKKILKAEGFSLDSAYSETIEGIPFLVKIVAEEITLADMRYLIDEGKKFLGSGVVCVVSSISQSGHLFVGVTKDLISTIQASDLVAVVAKELGKKTGGGRADMAQIGGFESSRIPAMIKALKAHVRNNV